MPFPHTVRTRKLSGVHPAKKKSRKTVSPCGSNYTSQGSNLKPSVP